MSGLVAWVDFARDLRASEDVFREMTTSLARRGPDAGDTWLSERAALGHRMLRVAGAEGATQPVMLDRAKGGVVACLVGHVANEAELRRELGEGSGASSEAEVLARAFLRWGEPFVERLDGMFVFAVWDARRGRLLFGRDRLGVKPLYYFTYPGGLIVASEPKGIMANPRFEARLEIEALPMLLQPRLALPGETGLRGLRELPPGHVATFSETGISTRRYWRLQSRPHEASFEATARRVRELLEDGVQGAVMADVPRGAMLSGGLDSTCVAALALAALRRRQPPAGLDTFCIRFESDAAHFVASELRPDVDAPYAARAAEHIGSRHRTVTASASDLDAVLPATRQARDLPGWGQFDASMYVLFHEMRRSCTVGLTGEAADEIFGGYPYLFDADLVRRDAFPWLGNGPRLADHFSPDVKRHVDAREDERARYAQLMADVPRLAGEEAHDARMREVLYLGMSGPLAVILDRKDRMSAAVGLELRVPFCDHRLVEYVWNVPWSMKSRGGAKGLLKAAVADVLPASTLERKKSAYPHIQDPEHDRALVADAIRILDDAASPVAALFDVAGTRRLISNLVEGGAKEKRSFPGGASPAYMLINLVELNHWLERYKVSLR